VAVYAGARGEMGVLVANTVGSNIFLLSLNLGTALLSERNAGPTALRDALLVLASTCLLVSVVWLSLFRWGIGIVLLVLYAVYLGYVTMQ
jgi:Ca2+/Na+ antiporter